MPTPSLLIRDAGAQDVAPLVALARQSFRDAYREFDDPAELEDYVRQHFTPAHFEALLADAQSTLLVAQWDGHLAGYAQLRWSAAPACVQGPAPIELCRLYLRHDAKGRGWGTALMQAVMARARQAGGRTLWLGVYRRNTHAREFYKRWGLADVGEKVFIFGGRPYADPVMAGPVYDASMAS